LKLGKPPRLRLTTASACPDLDSLCSALLCAYLRTYTPPNTLHIPLCHIPRDDLTLRPEFTEVLKRAAASPADVITLDELPKADELTDSQWFLVDHNSLTGRLLPYKDRVVGCIDHHDDEGHVPQDSEVRVIEKTGSCMTLIVEHCKEAWKGLRKISDPPAPVIDEQLGYLALSAILIDTHNLTDKTKTTPADQDAIRHLEATVVGPDYDRARFFAEVLALKQDITPLSMRDVLRKDYKEWEEGGLRLGTASAPVDFADLAAKAGGADALAADVRRFADEKGVDLFAVLTACTRHGVFCRELMVYARTEDGVHAARGFEKDCGGRLDLSAWDGGRIDADHNKTQWLRCWDQGRVEHSRKQVAPMLRDVMKTLGTN
jgi:exopolyphosphatase